jgi:HAD superfamily hydrolase (TIGR01509 family)
LNKLPVEAPTGGIDLSRIRGLLFDVDGTLSDTDDHMVQQLSGFLQPLSWLFRDRDPRNFSRALVMFSETPGNFLYSVADRLGLDAVIAGVYNWLAQKRPPQPTEEDDYQMIPGVKEMLAALADRYPLAVVSARDALTTHRFLEYFDLLPFFDSIVTSQTCRHTKPFPDPVLFASDQLGLPPDACLMIGDTIVDIRSGKAAGAQTLAVLCGFGTLQELRRAGADLILSTTPDLLKIMKS